MVYIAWNSYQRRAETLSKLYNLKLKYIYFDWEHKFFLAKLWSFVLKIIKTTIFLMKENPKVIFIQLPPTILLYNVYLISFFSGTKVVADCHNTMIFDDHWIKWPFAKYILRRVEVVAVHNNQLIAYTSALNIEAIVMRDPIPDIPEIRETNMLEKLDLENANYIFVPCSFQADEPFEVLLSAVRQFPDMKFVLTWYKEIFFKRNPTLEIPDNLIFSDFLPENDYNYVFKHAFGSLILTTRVGTQPSGASEAISLGVPMVMSDIDTTRALYEDAAILVDNTSEDIADGIMTLKSNRGLYKNRTIKIREHLVESYGAEMNAFNKKIQDLSKSNI